LQLKKPGEKRRRYPAEEAKFLIFERRDMKRSAILGSMISYFMLLTLVLSSLGLAQQATSKAKDFQWPPMLRVITAGTQTGSFASTNGWAPKLQAAIGINVRVIPEDGEVTRYVRFAENKEAELASIAMAEAGFAIESKSGYADKKAYPMKIMWHHNDTAWGFVVRGDSKFKTIYDLKQKGVRVAVSMQSPAMTVAIQEAMPAFLGWTREEAKQNWVYIPAGNYAENCRSVTDGKADVAYVSPISSITVEMEAHPKKIRWLPMPLTDKKGWKGYLSIRPTTIPTTLDWGVPSARGVDAISSNFLYYARLDANQEMIYRLAKWFNEGYESYKGAHSVAARMSLKQFRSFLDFCPMPVAEGTVRYLKEIGKWTAADDKWNEEANKLMDRWIKAKEATLAEAKAKAVKVQWEDKEYLNILNKHTAAIPQFMARVQ
jgi:TRAP transporter TAXI family solute receptor